MTTELLDLLNVLGRCVALEPRQDHLLDLICTGSLITVAELEREGILPAASACRRPPRPIHPDSPPLAEPSYTGNEASREEPQETMQSGQAVMEHGPAIPMRRLPSDDDTSLLRWPSGLGSGES